MADYFNNYKNGEAVLGGRPASPLAGATPVQRFMVGVNFWMTGALVVTALAAILTLGGFGALNPNISAREALNMALSAPLGSLIFGSRIGYIVLIVAELGLVVYISARLAKMSLTAAMVSFFVYASLNGITLSSIFLVYSLPSIVQAFLICAGMYAVMSVYGLVTKTDLTKVGNICFMALIGVIIASVVNIFLHSSTLSWIVSFVAVALFTALTAYDNQKLKYLCYDAPEGSDAYTKLAIFGALTLYLDFINLFLALLRIFGRSRE